LAWWFLHYLIHIFSTKVVEDSLSNLPRTIVSSRMGQSMMPENNITGLTMTIHVGLLVEIGNVFLVLFSGFIPV
jgi:hypothetical protein